MISYSTDIKISKEYDFFKKTDYWRLLSFSCVSTFFTVYPVDRIKGWIDGVGELELGELDAAFNDIFQVDPLIHVGSRHDVHGREGGIHAPQDALHHQLHPQLVIIIIILRASNRNDTVEARIWDKASFTKTSTE